MFDVIVIGGGAAGMMAAAAAAEYGAFAAVIEKNDRLGKKLAITGKGRCNLTNNSDLAEVMNNIPANARFLYSALSAFSTADVMDYFESLGVPLKTERGKRVFPVSDKASDVVTALSERLNQLGVKIIRGDVRELVTENGVCTGVRYKSGGALKTERAKAVILATGGKSYPKTGSDGYGYTLARQAGHTIVPPQPSLVPLETEQGWVSRAAGLNLRNCAVKLFDGEKRIYEDFGELMFTGFGVSGPTVLSASAHIAGMQRGRYSLVIDLKPALSEKQLDARLLRDFSERRGQPFIEAIGGLLPSGLREPIAELSGISPSKKVDEITREERRALIALLKGVRLDILRFRPIDEAII
ncbi:MAG: aminoacetone oxidase family FAD-binding enzyme, partial [Oscillospiraceae bacterium]|nr:aminoacetone oxidase family FAD-binding enzyme [Oscillospiraceae bacterium]